MKNHTAYKKKLFMLRVFFYKEPDCKVNQNADDEQYKVVRRIQRSYKIKSHTSYQKDDISVLFRGDVIAPEKNRHKNQNKL